MEILVPRVLPALQAKMVLPDLLALKESKGMAAMLVALVNKDPKVQPALLVPSGFLANQADLEFLVLLVLLVLLARMELLDPRVLLASLEHLDHQALMANLGTPVLRVKQVPKAI